MSKIANWINNSRFNNIPKKDKRFVIMLAFLLLALLAADFCINISGGQTSESAIDSTYQAQILALNEAYMESLEGNYEGYEEPSTAESSLFAFDPNTADKETLMRLGLSERQASTLIKYRDNGGKFRTADDFAKIHCISQAQHQMLRPYIAIKSQSANTIAHDAPAAHTGEDTQALPSDTEKGNRYFVFDPNSIEEADFMRLGFSSRQAASFVKYREKGKKFYVAEDFKDVSFVDERIFAGLKNYIRINIDSLTDNGRIRDLNTIDKSGLMECGMTDEEASKILEFREMIGAFYAPWQIKDCISQKRGNKLQGNFYVCNSARRNMLDIRTADHDELTQNPYISPMQAGEIIAHRADAEPLTAARLVELGIFDQSEMKRVANYLIMEK